MSGFGGRTDVQQTRVIAVVVINVLPEPATTCRSQKKKATRRPPCDNCIVNYTGPISLAFTFCDVTRFSTSCEEYKSLSYLTSIRW